MTLDSSKESQTFPRCFWFHKTVFESTNYYIGNIQFNIVSEQNSMCN